LLKDILASILTVREQSKVVYEFDRLDIADGVYVPEGYEQRDEPQDEPPGAPYEPEMQEQQPLEIEPDQPDAKYAKYDDMDVFEVAIYTLKH
jgi:hypothetical protein